MSIPVSLYAMPGSDDDILIEGRGVQADMPITPTADQVRKGEDAALTATLARIRNGSPDGGR